MTSEIESSGLSRRTFLGATFAAGVLLVAQQTPVAAHAAGTDVTLTAGGISILASVGGRVAIRDGADVVRMQGSRFQVKDTAAGILVSTGGTPSLVTLPDGTPAIRMDYVMPAAAGSTTVFGLFTVSTNHAHLEWHVAGPATLVPDGFSFSRAIVSASEPERFVPITEWARDSGGGIPFERTAGVAFASAWNTLHGLLLLERSKKDWTNATWVHSPGVLQPDGGYLSSAEFFFSSTRPSATASIGTSRALGVEIWTDKPFNIWETAGEPMTVHVQVANGAASSRPVDLSWWVRDFNGVLLASETITATIGATSTLDHSFTVSAPAYGIATAEISAVSGQDEAFARTNLTVMPNRPFTPNPASMFGIANYPWLQVPSAAALLDLWQRVGIKRVRISYEGGPGLPPSAFDARGIQHNIELQPDLAATDQVAHQWAVANTTKAIEAGAEYFEVGNELNRPFNTGVAAQAYIDKALRPVHDEIAARGAELKILNNGLAGMDKPWVQNFVAGGGWDLIDGFAYHPGRGNFTADYIPPGTDWGAGGTGSYWNYYGGLKQIKQLMQQYGAKDIWLTEAYACTRPNGWWNDTYRHAAENILLTLALARAEGVRNVMWYQFHDSVNGAPQVASPENVEYHFGLMNRDVSAKPSLLAYATAAFALDHASFLGWLAFDDPNHRGLLFDTPEGELAVLWNRADGYILNADHDPSGWHFPAPETWVDPWPTKTPLAVPTVGDTVTQVDVIGQTTTIPATGRTAQLVLDGAPRLYYGLALSGPTEGAAAVSGPVTVTPRKIGEHAGLAVSVHNGGTSWADIRITTPYGEHKLWKVPAGQDGVHEFPSDAAAIAAGSVKVAMYWWNDGSPEYQTHSVGFGGFSTASWLS